MAYRRQIKCDSCGNWFDITVDYLEPNKEYPPIGWLQVQKVIDHESYPHYAYEQYCSRDCLMKIGV